MAQQEYGLVGTISATKASFALVALQSGSEGMPKFLHQREVLPSDHSHFQEAVASFLLTVPHKPVTAAFAVAGPVRQNVVRTTHAHWRVRESDLVDLLGLPSIILLNDCEAAAKSLSVMRDEDLLVVAGPALRRRQFGARAYVSVGDGVGVAGLCETPTGDMPLDSEGGHSTFAAITELEYAISGRISAEEGRCSNEMFLSRAGVGRIYRALGALRGVSLSALKWDEVIARAQSGSDPIAVEVMGIYCGALGRFLGDIALIIGARDGVYFGGGLGNAVAPFLAQSTFRAQFDAKAPQVNYMLDIPTVLVRHPHPSLLGAAMTLRGDESGSRA